METLFTTFQNALQLIKITNKIVSFKMRTYLSTYISTIWHLTKSFRSFFAFFEIKAEIFKDENLHKTGNSSLASSQSGNPSHLYSSATHFTLSRHSNSLAGFLQTETAKLHYLRHIHVPNKKNSLEVMTPKKLY